MFDKLKKSLGLGSTAAAPPPIHVQGPYAQGEVNLLYHMLFCDLPELYRPRGESASHVPKWQSTLFAASPDPVAIDAITQDTTAESRVRLLAYHWLRTHGRTVPQKKLEGVVVEVPLDQGLDVLAAYSDGRVRYLNQSGRVSIFEDGPKDVVEKGRELLAASRPIVNQIGPWDKQRLLPPKRGNIRLSFLVSDGLYFGEGEFGVMEREALAAPVIRCAGQLLQLVVRR